MIHSAEIPFFLIVVLGGCALIYLLHFSRMPFMVRMSAAMAVAYFILDAGLAPLLTPRLGLNTGDPAVVAGGFAYVSEYGMAFLTLALHYGLVLAGLLVGWKFVAGTFTIPPPPPASAPRPASAFWRGSRFLFLAGAVAQAAILIMLLRGHSLLGLAAQRALFTDESVVFNPIYGYLSLIVPFMEVGAWGMLLSAKSLRRHKLAWLATGSVVMLDILYGGRTRTILSILMIILVYRVAYGRLSRKQVLGVVLAIVGGLSIIAMIRYGATNIYQGFRFTGGYLFFSRRLEQVAFALRTFPEVIGFFRGASVISAISFIIPGLKLPGINLYRHMMFILYGPQFMDGGTGGSNYAAAAEHFMNFGWPGVVVLALFYGIFFGAFFAWSFRYRHLPPFVMLFVGTVQVFFSGVDARSINTIASAFPAVLLPLGILCSVSFSQMIAARRFLLLLVVAFVFFFISRFDLPGTKWGMIASIGLSYWAAFRLLKRITRRDSALNHWAPSAPTTPLHEKGPNH